MNFVDIHFICVILITINCSKGKVLGEILKHSNECSIILENFANASASFMFCTLQNARPVHICCSCVKEYNYVLEKHEIIVQAKEKNSSCKEILINQDHVEVIESGLSYIKNLWSKGQCKNCFKNKDTLSNETKDFMKLYAEVNQCFEKYYYPENNTYNDDICFLCFKEYDKMRKFYENLKETSGNGNVCMDIVDTVNVTQHLWSNVLRCGETVMTFDIALLVLSVVFSIFPIIFYLSAWKFTKDMSSTVLNQNRVIQRFREKSKSQTGSSHST